MMRAVVLCLGIIVIVGTWSVAQAVPPATASSSQVTLQIQATHVVASGLTPGGQAVWFAVAKEREEWLARIVRRDRVDTADASGIVALDLGVAVSPVSVWAVVDMPTGSYAMSTPVGMPTHLVSFPSARLTDLGGGDYGFSDQREALEVLLVRPGQGAWRLSVIDGGPEDGDSAANHVLVAKPQFFCSLLPGDHPLKGFYKGDVMMAIDPVTFDHYATAIGSLKP